MSDSTFTHEVSPDGLRLISTKFVDGAEVGNHVTTWKTPEETQANLDNTIKAVEKNQEIFNLITGYAKVKKHTILGRTIDTFFAHGNTYDEAFLGILGSHSLVLNKKPGTDKTDWSSLHYEKRPENKDFLIGAGNKSAAFSVSVRK
jgi:hypothetical protein